MNYVAFDHPGGPEVLHVAQESEPQPGRGEVRIRVAAAGVTRADTMQRRGEYPPPPGVTNVLGLEVSGVVDAIGDHVRAWKPGDEVCALLAGGGYAEYALAAEGQVLPVPANWSLVEAATLPENAFTVYDNVFTRAHLEPGETLLVHGGTSGIGTTAIMFAKAIGARVFTTVGGPEKCLAAVRIGADAAIDYRAQDFVKEIDRLTGGNGVDVVLDIVGGDYIARDLQCLALDGRIACIAMVGGRAAEIDLATLVRRRASVMGSSLRPRTAEQKAAIARRLRDRIWPLLPARNPIVPIVDAVYPFDRAAEAHARLEASVHVGKILLVPSA